MGWKYFRMVNLFERSNENKLWIKNKVKEKRKEEIIMTERMKEIVAEALNVEIETLKGNDSVSEIYYMGDFPYMEEEGRQGRV